MAVGPGATQNPSVVRSCRTAVTAGEAEMSSPGEWICGAPIAQSGPEEGEEIGERRIQKGPRSVGWRSAHLGGEQLVQFRPELPHENADSGGALAHPMGANHKEGMERGGERS